MILEESKERLLDVIRVEVANKYGKGFLYVNRDGVDRGTTIKNVYKELNIKRIRVMKRMDGAYEVHLIGEGNEYINYKRKGYKVGYKMSKEEVDRKEAERKKLESKR